MEKLLGIVMIFAAGYLMFRLQAGTGGCCGGAHDHEGSGQCSGDHFPGHGSATGSGVSTGVCCAAEAIDKNLERE